MPPDVNTYDTQQADAAEKLAERWHTADPLRTGSAAPQDPQADAVRQWSPALVQAFLQRLAQYAGMSALKPATTRRMAELYGLDAMRNPEVRRSWLQEAARWRERAGESLLSTLLAVPGLHMAQVLRCKHRVPCGGTICNRRLRKSASVPELQLTTYTDAGALHVAVPLHRLRGQGSAGRCVGIRARARANEVRAAPVQGAVQKQDWQASGA